MWDSLDDVDLHVFTPDDSEIYYGNRTAQGGTLDVDANSDSANATTSPVENVYFANPQPGEYWVYLYNYTDRSEGRATNYIVRITVGDQSETYTGTIEGDDDLIEVIGFQYNG